MEDAMAALARSTLEEIEGVRWPDAGPDDSYLVRTCTALRRKPIGEFDPEDLRIMIGQEIGLDTLVPMAVGVLTRDPWAEGDMGPGDLLRAVLRVRPEWFADHPIVAEALRSVTARVDLLEADPLDIPDGLPELLTAWRTAT